MVNLAQMPVYYHRNNMDGFDGRQDDWMGLITLLILVAVVTIVIVLVIKYLKSSNNDKQALDYAKERYAKGEIDKKELENIRKELKIV
jgi:uncharacterized membrane protein